MSKLVPFASCRTQRSVVPTLMPSEAEAGLQLKLAVGGCAGKGAAGQADRLTEEWRTQVADRTGEIHPVQYVARVHAGRQVVAVIGGAGAEDRAHAGSWTSPEAAASTAGATASATTGAASAWTSGRTTALIIGSARLFSETKGLAQTEIQGELRGAGQIVDGDDGLPAGGLRIEGAEAGGDSTFGRSEVGRERGTIVEERVAVHVASDGDVVGHARGRDHEWACPEAVRQGDRSAQEHALMDVVGRTPVVLIEIVLVRGKTTQTGNIAMDVVQRVVSEQREPGAGADIAIHDQLVLSENSLGFVLVDIVARQSGAIVAGGIVRVEGAGQGRVDVAGQQLAEAA